MSLDDIDLAAMREGKAISKLRNLGGLRDRAKKEKKIQLTEAEKDRRAWDSIKGEK